jgi:hypothetical protein
MSKPISKKMAGQGAPGDEFIVEVDFDYCGVSYSGYQILTRTQIVKLCKQLESDRQIGTPNMPGDWWEEFDVSDLNGAFTIHSDRLEDVEAMRGLFGESVGNTELFEEAGDGLWEEEEEEEESPKLIDAEVARRYLESESIDLSKATELTDEAAKLLPKSQGTEANDWSDKVGWDLNLNGLTELSDAAAESLSKYEDCLYLDGLTELSDAAAESLSKHKGELGLRGLTELSDAAAESLSKHKGGGDACHPNF